MAPGTLRDVALVLIALTTLGTASGLDTPKIEHPIDYLARSTTP
jgi:hypothetical protein